MNKNITHHVPAGFGDVNLKQIFDDSIASRSHKNDRWKDYAAWTLPYAYLDEGDTIDEISIDYQATGATAVNHLTNKLTTTLFNPAVPFFRIEATPDMIEQAKANGMNEAELDDLIGKTEREAMKYMDSTNLRNAVLTSVRNLIITGNSLLYTPPGAKAKAKVYSLRDYIIKRDLSGSAIVIITRDMKSINALPEDLQELCNQNGLDDPNMDVTLLTGIFRTKEGKFVVKQEVEDVFIVPRKKGVYNEDNLPWIPLSWNLLRGEDYGNGLVEEYAGAFHTLSTLTEAMHNLVAIASDIKGLVDPMGSTDIETLNSSAPGTWVYGNRDDVDFLQLEKLTDMRFISEQIAEIKREIGQGFLIGSASTRDAERVTASEIEMQAMELEESLGGVYTRLAEELQYPVAIRLLAQVDKDIAAMDISVVTGVDSLSRKSELDQIRLLFQDLTILNSLPPEVAKYLQYGEVINTFATHRGVDTEQFLKSTEAVEKEEQRQIALQAQLAKATAVQGKKGA
jgi:hypothetical protein